MSNQKQKTGKKPDLCPFCGGDKYTAISAHNRVARAVRAAKESESGK